MSLVTAIICAYNEADILPWTLKHLREQGVWSHVIDNWSKDQTWEIASEYADSCERFPAKGPTGTYDWDDLLRRVETLAESTLRGTWCMHHDADEIRISDRPGETLKEAVTRINNCDYTAINFRVVNFAPTRDGWDGSQNPEEFFTHHEEHSSYDRQLHVKAWKNLGPVDLHSRGGHEAWFDDLRIYPSKLIIKHYPIRSQSQGERKIFNDRKPRWNPREKFEKGWHVQYDGINPGHRFVRSEAGLKKWEGL